MKEFKLLTVICIAGLVALIAIQGVRISELEGKFNDVNTRVCVELESKKNSTIEECSK